MDYSPTLVEAPYRRAEAVADALEAEMQVLRATRSWLWRSIVTGTAPEALTDALWKAWWPEAWVGLGPEDAPAEAPDAIEWESAALFEPIPPDAQRLFEDFLVVTAERRLGLV